MWRPNTILRVHDKFHCSRCGGYRYNIPPTLIIMKRALLTALGFFGRTATWPSTTFSVAGCRFLVSESCSASQTKLFDISSLKSFSSIVPPVKYGKGLNDACWSSQFAQGCFRVVSLPRVSFQHVLMAKWLSSLHCRLFLA
jgi:hypothetical protein